MFGGCGRSAERDREVMEQTVRARASFEYDVFVIERMVIARRAESRLSWGR